jgi:hypothetical protein
METVYGNGPFGRISDRPNYVPMTLSQIIDLSRGITKTLPPNKRKRHTFIYH